MRVRFASESINEKFMFLLLVIVAARGFLNNFFDTGTMLVDVTFSILILTFFFWNKRKLRINNLPMKLYSLIVILSFFVFIYQVIVGQTDFYRGLIEIRSYIVYSLTFLFMAFCLSYNGCKRVVSVLTSVLFFINCFGIVQFVFVQSLPEILLTPKEVKIFLVNGLTDLIRVNALLGTTIDFGQICVISIGLLTASIASKYNSNVFTYLKLIAATVACVLTFSRAAMVGGLMVAVCIYAIIYREKITLKKILAAITALFTFLILIYVFSDFILYRFSFDNSAEMQRNDDGHYSVIYHAIKYIIDYPLAGYSADFDVSSEIIGDGTFWMHMLQWGIPIAVLWLLLTFVLMRYADKLIKEYDQFTKMIGLCFVMLTIELWISSLIDSGFQNRFVHTIYWLLGGVVVNLYLNGHRLNRRTLFIKKY